MTVRLKHGIENDEFENGARMEKLEVIFANRYVQVFERYSQHKPITQSRQVAERFSQTLRDEHEKAIQQIGTKNLKQVNIILFKGFWITLMVWLIRIGESRSVSRNIQILR